MQTILSVIFLWWEISPKLGIFLGKNTKKYVNTRCEIMIHTATQAYRLKYCRFSDIMEQAILIMQIYG
jgi:hypothetical protein